MKTFTHPNIELRCNCTHNWGMDRQAVKSVLTLDWGPKNNSISRRPFIYEYYSGNKTNPKISYCSKCGLFRWEIVE